MRRQLRRSFRRLEAERDRLRLLLERLHEGVLTIDQDLVVHFANTEARRILGGRLREGDELPEPWQSFGLRDFAQGLFDERAAVTQVHVTPDEQHAYGVVGIPSQPETDWALLVVDDLTEQERRELAEREFVSNAAHELRTPLTTIIGAVEVLQAGAKEDPAERDRFLGHIEREAGRLARLARAMLTLARAHSGQEPPRVEAVELAPLLRDVAAGLQPARRRRGRRRGRPTASRSRRTATCSSRRCAISARTRPSTRRAARSSSAPTRDGNTVTIEVEDSGPGDQPRGAAPRLRSLLPRRARRARLRPRARDRAGVGANARRPHRARLRRRARGRSSGSCSLRRACEGCRRVNASNGRRADPRSSTTTPGVARRRRLHAPARGLRGRRGAGRRVGARGGPHGPLRPRRPRRDAARDSPASRSAARCGRRATSRSSC